MTPRCPWVQRIEFAISNPVESHRAGAPTNHGRKNKPKRLPAWPPPILSGGYGHCCQGERQGEDCMRKPNELSPFAYHRKKVKRHSGRRNGEAVVKGFHLGYD